MYTLGWNQPGRRAGLTRDGYKAPSLLQTISSPNNREATMSPATGNASDEEIYALPKDDSSSSSDEENARRAADIKPTQFIRRGSEEPKSRSNVATKAKRKRTPDAKPAASRARNTRSSHQFDSEHIPGASGNFCGKDNGEDDIKFGTGLVDEFGQVKSKKIKSGKTYGYGRTNSTSSRPQAKTLKGMSLFAVYICLGLTFHW